MSKQPRVVWVPDDLLRADSDGRGQSRTGDSRRPPTRRLFGRIEKLARLDVSLALEAKNRAKDYDVVFAMSEKIALPLALIKLQCPLLAVAHYMAHPLRKPLGRVVCIQNNWHRIGYLTTRDRDWMSAYYGIPPERFFRVLAAPLDRFLPGHIVSDGPILSIGVAKRDYGTLMAAVEQLPHAHVDIHASSRYGDTLLGKIGNRVPSRVRILSGGSLTDQELAERYRQARFAVLPLHRTNHFSAGVTSALEAASSGKALIATDTPGMRDYVIDGVTGYLVPPGDVHSLAQAIGKLWDDPTLSHKMGLEARRFVERCFSPAQIAREIETAICEAHAEYQRSSQQA